MTNTTNVRYSQNEKAEKHVVFFDRRISEEFSKNELNRDVMSWFAFLTGISFLAIGALWWNIEARHSDGDIFALQGSWTIMFIAVVFAAALTGLVWRQAVLKKFLKKYKNEMIAGQNMPDSLTRENTKKVREVLQASGMDAAVNIAWELWGKETGEESEVE